MEILRSLIFNIILILSIILMGVISLPLLMGPREGVAFLRDVWIKFVIGTLEIVVGLQYQVDGLQNLPAQKIIIAAGGGPHQRLYPFRGHVRYCVINT